MEAKYYINALRHQQVYLLYSLSKASSDIYKNRFEERWFLAVKSEGKKHKILLIEDHADSRDLVELVLAGENYDVEAAATGATAIASLTSKPCPNLILLDISLPGMSGEEFMCHRLRAHFREFF